MVGGPSTCLVARLMGRREMYDDCTRHTQQDITLGSYMASPFILWLPVFLTVDLITPNLQVWQQRTGM